MANITAENLMTFLDEMLESEDNRLEICQKRLLRLKTGNTHIPEHRRAELIKDLEECVEAKVLRIDYLGMLKECVRILNSDS